MHAPHAPSDPSSNPRKLPAREISESALHAWLFDSGVCDEHGQVLSWLNPKKPGYVYAEIMGYYASLCAERSRSNDGRAWLARGQLVARAIVASLSPAGALGRSGIDYTFDTGIGLCGLARVDGVAGRSEFKAPIASMRDFLVRSLSQRAVAWKGSQALADDTSWSHSFGASSLKAGIALDMAATVLGDESARMLARSIARDVVGTCFRHDSFQINGECPWVYAHAHCYALEGLLALASRGLANSAAIRPAAGWLARAQNSDGSLTNWHGRSEAVLAHQGDATSQAVRIWSAVDRAAFAANIARANEFLASLQTPSGGLRYNAASDDVNSWVSIFATQAISWARGPAEVEWLL